MALDCSEGLAAWLLNSCLFLIAHHRRELFPAKAILLLALVHGNPLDIALTNEKLAERRAIGLDMKLDVLGEDECLRNNERNVMGCQVNLLV